MLARPSPYGAWGCADPVARRDGGSELCGAAMSIDVRRAAPSTHFRVFGPTRAGAATP
ncbi:hypothetical protein BH18ACT7_BH18ACT7_13150 [soil metagenome]